MSTLLQILRDLAAGAIISLISIPISVWLTHQSKSKPILKRSKINRSHNDGRRRRKPRHRAKQHRKKRKL